MNKFPSIATLIVCITVWSKAATGQEITVRPLILGALQENSMISGELVGGKSNHVIFAKAHEHPYANQILVPVIDGKFQLMLPAGYPEAYMLIPEENFEADYLRPFVVFSEENVYVKIYPGERYKENTVSGSPLTDEYLRVRADIEQRLSPRLAEIDSLRKRADEGLIEEAEVELKDSLFNLDHLYWMELYIREHPTLVSYQLMKELLIATDSEVANDIAKRHYQTFATRFPDHPYTGMTGAYLNGKFQLESGRKYISFHADDLKGNRVLVDTLLAPKATLLNFWASWCGPCIGKARTMVPVYEAFNGKGFDIINIAREIRNIEALNNLLEREKLPWQTNLVDLESKYSVWTKYGITNLGGAMVLIDASGTILAVNPTADDVKRILKKIT